MMIEDFGVVLKICPAAKPLKVNVPLFVAARTLKVVDTPATPVVTTTIAVPVVKALAVGMWLINAAPIAFTFAS
jgi:hypothetical protein